MSDIPAPLADVRNVFIEITSRCNMSCKFCPYPVLQRPKQDMPHAYALKILEELRGQKKDVTFHVLGEPLLNSHFFEYAALCDEYGINYWLVTNGLLLTPRICDKLFALKNLKNLEISFHTFTEKSFRLRECAMPFDKYLARIRNAVFSPARYAAGIAINMDVMYDLNLLGGKAWNSFCIDEWRIFAQILQSWRKELDAAFPDAKEKYSKYFTGRKKIFQRGDYYLYRNYEDIPANLFAELPPHIQWIRWEIFPNTFVTLKKFFFFSKNDAYLKNALNMDFQVRPRDSFKCGWPQDLTILSNGDISLCCLDYEGEISVGNIKDINLAEAAASAKRKAVIANPGQFEFCARCQGTLTCTS